MKCVRTDTERVSAIQLAKQWLTYGWCTVVEMLIEITVVTMIGVVV